MLLGAGCGGPSPGAEDTRERDLRNAHQRVEGTWLLVGFEPEKPLGAPFDALVRDQIGKLELTMAAGNLSAMGAGFQASRSYEITSASPDTAQAVLMDDMNVRYELDLMFQGSHQLGFVSKTSPWRGQGTLQRQ